MHAAIRRALLSVTRKEGLQEFAVGLTRLLPHIQLVASGGTARTLAQAHIPTTPIETYTQFPECFAGRVKTLHPRIMGGILFRRDLDVEEAKRLQIEPIDLVVCNLYDFAASAQRETIEMAELMESMDIGGSTLIRSACKNYAHVAVVVDPQDYPRVLEALQQGGGTLSMDTRKHLAVKALQMSAEYEALLLRECSRRLVGEERRSLALVRGRPLRYGENPDQKAWVYELDGEQGIAQAEVLCGKELSYNNYEDATAAHLATQELVEGGAAHAVAIVKHGNLCGLATACDLVSAFARAWAADPKSAFGGIVSVSSSVPDALYPLLKEKFIELLIAPDFSDSFVALVRAGRPNLRLLRMQQHIASPLMYKTISGGMLAQTRRVRSTHPPMDVLFQTAVVTKRRPAPTLCGLAEFAITAICYGKSNAIAIVREYAPGFYQLLGMGSGQPNRVDSLQRLALPKAIENLRAEHPHDPQYDTKEALKECILASDGFFPFDDSVRFAGQSGIRLVIQPGGSTRDPEVIQAADALDMSMILTGNRYFTH